MSMQRVSAASGRTPIRQSLSLHLCQPIARVHQLYISPSRKSPYFHFAQNKTIRSLCMRVCYISVHQREGPGKKQEMKKYI